MAALPHRRHLIVGHSDFLVIPHTVPSSVGTRFQTRSAATVARVTGIGRGVQRSEETWVMLYVCVCVINNFNKK